MTAGPSPAAIPSDPRSWPFRLPPSGWRGAAGPDVSLVVGGSLGAKVLNETVAGAVATLPGEQRPQIRHQAGELTLEAARTAYAEAGVEAEVNAFHRRYGRGLRLG